MKIDIITIFPDFFTPLIETSIVKRAIDQGIVTIKTHQLRDFSKRKHQYVDDTPYGGGRGMLLQFPPLYEAIKALKTENSTVILLSPQGQKYEQETAKQLALSNHLILICGHYEGVDARIEDYIDMELSIGDYILTGGEIPAMIVADSVIRLLPGSIQEESQETDSLQQGWLKYPQYTKPESYLGHDVPEILRSGHHQNIEDWRQYQSIKRTYQKRPDLLKKIKLTAKEAEILEEIKKIGK